MSRACTECSQHEIRQRQPNHIISAAARNFGENFLRKNPVENIVFQNGAGFGGQSAGTIDRQRRNRGRLRRGLRFTVELAALFAVM